MFNIELLVIRAIIVSFPTGVSLPVHHFHSYLAISVIVNDIVAAIVLLDVEHPGQWRSYGI
jgi:hypothetical protein